MRCWIGLVASAAAIGCTASNPNFIGNVPSSDLASNGGAHDLAGVGGDGGGGGGHGSGLDMADHSGDMAAQCSGDQRLCIQVPSPTSVLCTSGMFVKDRVCPFGNGSSQGAVCQNGYCAPPTTNGTTSCGTGGPLEQVCEQMGSGTAKPFSCQPFISNPSTPTVDWWCAVAANKGAGVAGSSCTKDSDCHTGFCASNGTCFWSCQSTGDCLSATLTCKAVTIKVEHVQVSATSCAP
jgi:hypothetical protein